MKQTTAPTPGQPGRWVVSKFGPPSVLKWQTWDPLPTPSKDEVLISILVAGASGADNIQRAGGYPDSRTREPGFSQGYDFVGEIEALGPDVPQSLGLAKGDRVASMCTIGAYATHIVLPAGEILKLEKNDDPIQMCALPLNYMTAYGLLKRTGITLERGSTILIGSVSGGVGTAMAQLVAAFEMGITMYGTCSASKFDFVKSLGVTPIDRRDPDIVARVRELTGGKMVDEAYDSVGGKESLAISAACVKKDTGHVVGLGVMSNIKPDGSGMLPTDFDTWDYVDNHMPNANFFAVTWNYYYPQKEQFRQDFEAVAEKVRTGRMKPFVGQLFRLSDAIKLNEYLVSGQGVFGKMEMLVDADLAKANGL